VGRPDVQEQVLVTTPSTVTYDWPHWSIVVRAFCPPLRISRSVRQPASPARREDWWDRSNIRHLARFVPAGIGSATRRSAPWEESAGTDY
jgi:hypothetical protein